MNGYIMNYIQSFRPNGLANANGSIHVANPIWLEYYDLENSKWKRSEDGFIALDENGVSNKLWKYSMGGDIVVKDQAGTEIFNYQSPSDWNDSDFELELSSFNAALNDLLSLSKFEKIYASKVNLGEIDLTDTVKRNYVAVLNDRNTNIAVKIRNFSGIDKTLTLEPQLMIVGYINTEGKFFEL
ncbi:MAG: hypothetical protein FWF63_00790 [Fibromonadales bacterium]|nr:hypothetical protein [Fibromonadales bacterium]